MKILTIQKNINEGIITNNILFHYESLITDFGLEATANLLNAFNAGLIEVLEKILDEKYKKNSYISIVDGNIKIITNNNKFQDVIKKLVEEINHNKDNIVNQIKNEDLLLEDEQKDFFIRILSYELLHIILQRETDKVKDGNDEDKKSSKI